MSSYRALYRKYRPYDFDDVAGQKAVTDILKYEVENGKLSHAYLFCGSRGTGKTSCAKILSKAVNCLNPKNGNPCNACEACRSIDRAIATDVIEMDAASNNGVDNVRDLKDEISFTPATLKYRVYIIDEVHMMSQAAFNALLKTLEEPPAYVIFILATTEFHKLPTTIVSRCQRFDFKRLSSEELTGRLHYVAKKEGIDLTEDGARVIARLSQGGMRDAISLLELCASSRRTVDETLVTETAGSGNRENAYQMLSALSSADYSSVYSIIHNISMASSDLSVFFGELIDAYRDLMVTKTCPDARTYLDLTDSEHERLSSLAAGFTMARLQYHTSLLSDAYAEMQRGTLSKRALAEITLARICDPCLSDSPEALALRVEELEKQLSLLRMGVTAVQSAAPTAAASEKKEAPAPVQKAVSVPPSAPSPASTPAPQDVPAPSSTPTPFHKWSRVVERIGQIKRPLSVQFISATATFAPPHTYTIAMGSFFAEKLSKSETDLTILRGVIAEVEGISPADITLSIVEHGKEGQKTAASELDEMFRL